MVRAVLFGLVALISVMSISGVSAATLIEGEAEAINADILRIGEQRVVLWGIDAPDPGQPCIASGKRWGCFDAAMRALQVLISRGPVTCVLTEKTDPFNRGYGVCESRGVDIGAELVRVGMAMAYPEETDAYVKLQSGAIGAGVGLWQPGVEFQRPWEWREIESPGGYK